MSNQYTKYYNLPMPSYGDPRSDLTLNAAITLLDSLLFEANENIVNGVSGPSGPIASFSGLYSSEATYAVGQAVSYNGSSYISLVANNSGNAPDTATSYWTVLAAQGTSGRQGVDGKAGPVGPAGTLTVQNNNALSNGPLAVNGQIAFPTFQMDSNNLDASGKPTNVPGQDFIGGLLQSYSSGFGANFGNDGGWSVIKLLRFLSEWRQRGISQAQGLELYKRAVGDFAGIYMYMRGAWGRHAQSDEEAVCANLQLAEDPGQFQGTISSTTGTGDIAPALNYVSGPEYTIDGSFLINISKGNVSGSLNGASQGGPASYTNHWPVTNVLVNGQTSNLPITTAWATLPDGTLTAHNVNQAITVVTTTVTLQPLNGVKQPFVNGIVSVAGNEYPEQCKIVAGAVSSDGNTQTVTLYVRNPNYVATIFQGGLAGWFFSSDTSMSQIGLRTCYYIFGSLDGVNLIYGVNIGGTVGTSLPYPNGSMPWATTGSTAGFHLYPGAEIIANSESSAYAPTLEANNVSWAVGDTVESPKFPSAAGSNIALNRIQYTATNPSVGAQAILSTNSGSGITQGYSFLRVFNNNPASMYAGRGAGGSLFVPSYQIVKGEWAGIYDGEYAPGPGERMIRFGSFAGGQSGSSYTSPISVIEFPEGQSSLLYDPATKNWIVNNFHVYDNMMIDGRLTAGIIQVSGVVPQGGSYGSTDLYQPGQNGGADVYNDKNNGDGTTFNFRTWNQGHPIYLNFNDQGNIKWRFGKNSDNSLTLLDTTNNLELIHANSNGLGITNINLADGTSGGATLPLHQTGGKLYLGSTLVSSGSSSQAFSVNNVLMVSSSSTQTLTTNSFLAYQFETVGNDPFQAFNHNTGIWTCPATGLYLIITKLRPVDNATSGLGFGHGPDTSNQDSPDFLWAQTFPATSNGKPLRNSCWPNTRSIQLNQGDQVRMVYYTDSSGVQCSAASMVIDRLS